MTRLRLTHALALLNLLAGGCTTTTPLQPEGTRCLLGPLAMPEIAADGSGASEVCRLVATGCPLPKPFGAPTLVGVATCDYADGATPCTPRTTTCPLTDPRGNQAIRFEIGERVCTSVVEILLQATGDGGAGIEWRVQERELAGNRCVSKGSPRIGVANVLGSCCSTELNLDVPEHDRIFRVVARTDWLKPTT